MKLITKSLRRHVLKSKLLWCNKILNLFNLFASVILTDVQFRIYSIILGPVKIKHLKSVWKIRYKIVFFTEVNIFWFRDIIVLWSVWSKNSTSFSICFTTKGRNATIHVCAQLFDFMLYDIIYTFIGFKERSRLCIDPCKDQSLGTGL